MTNYEMFENQFNAIKSNCEITQIEYELFILQRAEKIAYQYYLETESHSIEEAFYDELVTAIKATERAIEPF